MLEKESPLVMLEVLSLNFVFVNPFNITNWTKTEFLLILLTSPSNKHPYHLIRAKLPSVCKGMSRGNETNLRFVKLLTPLTKLKVLSGCQMSGLNVRM